MLIPRLSAKSSTSALLMDREDFPSTLSILSMRGGAGFLFVQPDLLGLQTVFRRKENNTEFLKEQKEEDLKKSGKYKTKK